MSLPGGFHASGVPQPGGGDPFFFGRKPYSHLQRLSRVLLPAP